MLEHVKCETPDLAKANLEKLKALFPGVVTEGPDGVSIDVEALKQECSATPIEGNVERYEFTWPGKRAAKAAASASTTKTLRPCREESVNFDTTENLYIEGDNLEVLKLLQTSYAGKIKMIYIDPPYNTGHDFVYRDRFSLTQKELESDAGAFDEDGNRFEVNDSAEARYHSNWCSMMYPRLKLARNLLSDDGVMFISIDGNEVSNAKRICDEIFGEKNKSGCLIIETATDNNPSQISIEHEYMLCYAKDMAIQPCWMRRSEAGQKINNKYLELKSLGLPPSGIQVELRKWIKVHKNELPQVSHYDNVDEKGVYHDGDVANTKMGGYRYDVIHPITKKPCKVPEKGFRFPHATMMQMIVDGDILFGEDESVLIKPKKRLENVKELLRSVIYEDGRAATKALETLLVRGVFNNPKSVTILLRLIDFTTNKDALVLDFFSGSATTAHAVMQLNAEDGGNRKFIMVQLPEPCAEDSEAAKAGYKNICEIGKERIRRAGKKLLAQRRGGAENGGMGNGGMGNGVGDDLFASQNLCGSAPLRENDNLDIGFRVLKLDSSSLNDTSATVSETTQEFANFDRIKNDRSSEDLLFQVLLETHIPLSDKIVRCEVGGNEVLFVGGVDAQESTPPAEAPLLACLDAKAKMTTDFFIEIAKLKPGIAFFRDDAFADDSARTNLQQSFEQFSPSTAIKVI